MNICVERQAGTDLGCGTNRVGLFKRIRVPAWTGSLLFHLVVFLLILFYLQLRPVAKTAPGEWNATGGIVLKQRSQEGDSYVDSENNRYGEASPESGNDEPIKAPTLEQAIAGELSDIRDLKQMLPQTTLGSQAASGAARNVPAAAAIADALQKGGSRTAGPGRDLGGKVRVRVFNTEGKGTNFIYVFDRSGSMNEFGGRPIRAAKAELIKSLEPLDKFHKFNIIFYNEKSNPWNPGKMLFANEVNKANAIRFVGGIIPMGGTRHRDPLVEAIRQRPDVIFFLTDGDENDALTPGQLQDIQRLNNNIGAGAQINVIQFGVGENRQSQFLRALAAQNQGEYVYVNVAAIR